MELPPLADTITQHGLNAKKSLGQHFLLDQNITDKVARAAGNLREVNVIEIGPGPGGLTRSLLAAGAQTVYAVEKDARCIAALTELQEAYPGRLHILEADALEVNLPALVPAPRKIVANLPYNVGTALLVGWLGEIDDARLANRASPEPASCDLQQANRGGNIYGSLTLMFQKEVADRIAAAPGGKEYGRLSVITQWLCDVRHDFDLPPGAFSPPPKVHSSVITLTPHPMPLYPTRKEALERVLASAFNQRRKMLRQSLKSLGGQALLDAAGIDGTRRAETLTIQEFCALAEQHVLMHGE